MMLNRWPTKWHTSSPPASTSTAWLLYKYIGIGRRLNGLPIHHAAGCPIATDVYSVEVATGTR